MVQSETPLQSAAQQEGDVLVVISYAASRKGSWEGKYPHATPLSVVREAAMAFFGVADNTDNAGNGERYELMDRGETLDLSVAIGDIADDSRSLVLRLTRRLVAG